MENPTLDKLDRKILKLITNNARISFLEVARICNISGAAVHQRVQKMMNNGIITGSEFTLNLEKIGYSTCAFVKLEFKAEADIEAAVRGLQKIPHISESHYVSGPYDLLVKIYALNNQHLMEIIQRDIKPLGLRSSESVISYKESFCRQISITSFEDDEQDED